MPGTTKLFGKPSGIPYILSQVDTSAIADAGGLVSIETAAATLAFGDAVFRLPGGRVDKSLEASLYPANFVGIVVGGSATQYMASNDAGLIGSTVATIGQAVLVQTRGKAYVAADASAQVRMGDPLVAGQTTAGRILGGVSSSYSENNPALAIKAGGGILVKAVNAARRIHAGVVGTNTAANLDMAALSGTTANGKFAIYVFRVAADGTTVTSAKSADANSLAEIIWPTAGAANLVTLGYVVINPTGTGGFVGGTTALDSGTVVPNAQYYNLVGRYNRLGIAITTPATGAGSSFLMDVLA